jgi:AcrR family transcriptional regulator
MPKQTFFNLPAGKRKRIIDVAITEFLENDYQAASISRICAAAEIAKGSFYQYFTGKEDLYLHLFELMATAKGEFLKENLPDPQTGIFEYMRRLAEIGVEFELAYPRLSKLGYRAAAGNALPAGFEERMQQDTLAFFRRLLAQGKAQGSIAPEIDEDLAAFMLNSLFGELGRYLMQRAEAAGLRPGENGNSLFAEPQIQALLNQTFDILEKGFRQDLRD